MNMYIEHIKAWWRGDITQITAVFDKTAKKLQANRKYLTTVADNQAMMARDLEKRSAWLYEQASKSAILEGKFLRLLSGDA